MVFVVLALRIVCYHGEYAICRKDIYCTGNWNLSNNDPACGECRMLLEFETTLSQNDTT